MSIKMVSLDDIRHYVEEKIPVFHEKRLQSLLKLKLSTILKRKNPYLFRAKNLVTAEALVKTFLDAHLSSQEETIFGDFLEDLAIFINSQVYGGIKSAAEGIDLEFSKENIRYLVSIKSGPNWGNSSQIKKMRDNFRQAKKVLRQRNKRLHIVTVNGCCYGRQGQQDKGDYLKLCGQDFWQFISGNENLYIDIIDPLGHQAREKNEEFAEKYVQILSAFSYRFMQTFYSKDGIIDWQSLIAFNSSQKPPGREIIKKIDG